MMTRTAVLSALLTVSLGAAAIAAPSRDRDGVAGKRESVRNLLAEVRAARNAIARDERKVAEDLVSDAIKLDTTLGARHRFAVLHSETGEIEQVAPMKGAPVAKVYDKFTEHERLDLKATRIDLERARAALATGNMAGAEKDLDKVERAISFEARITPEPSKLAAENLRFAIREIEAGKWQAAKVDLDAVMKDISLEAAKRGPDQHAIVTPKATTH